MRASARIPFFAGAPVELRGDRFLDASIYESIPYRTAMNNNDITDIVVLLTRPEGNSRSEPGWVDRYIVAPYLAKFDPELKVHHLERAAQYRQELEAIFSHASLGSHPRMLPIQIPKSAHKIGSLETSRAKLVNGAIDGFQATYSALGLAVPSLVELLTPV